MARFGEALRRFPASLYLSDLILDERQGPLVRGFSYLLSAFVRGKVHLHFGSPDEAARALRACGLPGTLLDPRELDGVEREGAGRVRIIEATAG